MLMIFIIATHFNALYNRTGTNFDYIDLKSGDAYLVHYLTPHIMKQWVQEV